MGVRVPSPARFPLFFSSFITSNNLVGLFNFYVMKLVAGQVRRNNRTSQSNSISTPGELDPVEDGFVVVNRFVIICLSMIEYLK